MVLFAIVIACIQSPHHGPRCPRYSSFCVTFPTGLSSLAKFHPLAFLLFTMLAPCCLRTRAFAVSLPSTVCFQKHRPRLPGHLLREALPDQQTKVVSQPLAIVFIMTLTVDLKCMLFACCFLSNSHI